MTATVWPRHNFDRGERSHPFLNPDGSTDIRALCLHWDERANHGASRSPNPIPDPREGR